jgi:hypothetical protein
MKQCQSTSSQPAREAGRIPVRLPRRGGSGGTGPAGATGSDLDDGCPADRLRHENAAARRQCQLGAAVGRLGQADLLSG